MHQKLIWRKSVRINTARKSFKGVMRTLLLPEKLLHSRSRSGGNISLCSIPKFKNKTNYLDSLFEIFPWDQVYISSSFHHLKSPNWDWLDLIEVEIGTRSGLHSSKPFTRHVDNLARVISLSRAGLMKPFEGRKTFVPIVYPAGSRRAERRWLSSHPNGPRWIPCVSEENRRISGETFILGESNIILAFPGGKVG